MSPNCFVDMSSPNITTISPEPSWMGRIYTELMHELAKSDISRKFGVRSIRVNISATHDYHKAVTSVCKKQGFVQTESVTVFTCRRDKDEHWRTFMEEKGEKMCGLLERWGYKALSFEEASDDVMAQLYEPEKYGYGDTFDVAAFLNDPAKSAAMDMSFAAVLDGRLAAYTLVTRDSSEAVVFQIISDAQWARGSGVILLPFVQSMKKFYEGDYKTAFYAMYASNKEANAFRESALGGFYTECSETQNYYYIYK